jgi:hypothetical protein
MGHTQGERLGWGACPPGDRLGVKRNILYIPLIEEKMKSLFENSLFGNPVGWSKSVAGSWWRFGTFIGIHVLFCVMMGLNLYDEGKIYYLPGILIFGVLFPFYYLYALRRLLILIEVKDQESTPKK